MTKSTVRQTIKQLVEKLFSEIKDSIKIDPNKPDNKKQKFVKALISSVQKISKIIKQSAKLVINLWPGQKPLLDERTEATSDQQSLSPDHKDDQTSDSSELDTNPGKEN